ncbi:MAG TPA: hypothetical protein DDY78_17980 [Planctomycetales bacterium]|jgi:hypothetical protein|nr:hypothetical protein [Planctomycetales bacterium]
MNKLHFLVDQCTPPFLAAALRQGAAGIDVLQVGDAGVPPLGTPDPDLLIAADASARVFITKDRRTMPGHLIDHYAAGNHTAGVMLMRNNFALSVYVQKIVNYWTTTTADDWVDRMVYIP